MPEWCIINTVAGILIYIVLNFNLIIFIKRRYFEKETISNEIEEKGVLHHIYN